MLLDAALLNTQHYKMMIKGKVEQSRERSSSLPYISCVLAIEKGAFGSPSTNVLNITYKVYSAVSNDHWLKEKENDSDISHNRRPWNNPEFT